MSVLDDCYEFRSELASALERDLLGPASEDEMISDPPITKYITGVLYPQSAGVLEGYEDVDDEDEDADDAPDPPIAMANVRYPASMGITFAVDSATAKSLVVELSAARYTAIEREDPPADTPTPSEQDQHDEDQRRQGWRGGTEGREPWKRQPTQVEPVEIDVSKPATNTEEVAEGLELFYRVRAADGDGRIPVTVVLVNRLSAPASESRDAYAYFQPLIQVRGKNGEPLFVERPTGAPPGVDEDLRSYRLLYRHARAFATGHGCAAEWEVASSDSDRATVVRSSFMPRHELALADSNPEIRDEALGMRFLAERPFEQVESGLNRFCNGYEEWISLRDSEIPSLSPELRPIARDQLAACQEALSRMRQGVSYLSGDEQAQRAFRLANQAMHEQRARTDWLKSGRPEAGPDQGADHAWRPFQLAFILLCVTGISSDSSSDREYADLLWFPTGGGKTEAYLGLIAFTAFLRRLRHGQMGGGVCVIMRYTLRLLTIQQFERAALLICAMEQLRRANRTELGSEEFSIGLWVGQGATPNRLAEARRSLDKLRRGQELEEGNPVQMHSCAWCGVGLDHSNYYISQGRGRLVVTCRNNACEYKDALPVHVVDEDIYHARPTLLIATADKFASIAWRAEAATLFNLVQSVGPAPELIIQDELHLISGPLGTLAGLYEAAIDLACTRDGIRPKVIASTATIRRAAHQSKALFDREVRQFPAPGLDARNSYFAIEAGRAEKGTRLYVGAMAPGTSQTTLLVRTFAALLQFAKEVAGSDDARDPYWTLVGYFNSLRVLGGARMQVQDDVRDRIGLLAAELGSEPREPDPSIELTSREPSSVIPAHLRQMAVEYPDQNSLAVILATNMISVGVDIDRLGLMAVMGQPQSTSEYIQATSRVGRRFPGLVVTMFNSARSRDRSHYESFVPYHTALYRQVESTSATPFSARARDRGLHAVVVALARLLVSGARANDSAANIASFKTALKQLCDTVVARVARVSPRDAEVTRDDLDEVITQWEMRVAENADLVYSNRSHPDKALLIDAAHDDAEETGSFPTLWSLRDVDQNSNLFPVG